jgi:endonuclease/exonuclease/phosphatase (EEP) superfamily protein YafD
VVPGTGVRTPYGAPMPLRVRTDREIGHFLGWLVLGPLAVATLARVVAWDASSSLVIFNALLPFMVIPAALLALLGALLERRVMLGVGAVVAATLLALTWPEGAAARPLPRASAGAPSVVLFDAEVKAGRDHPADYAREIAAARADVVTLQQATPAFVARVRALVPESQLRYQTRFSGLGGLEQSSLIVLSRYPLAHARMVDVAHRPNHLGVLVQIPGHPLRLFDVHPAAPIGGKRGEWVADLKAIRAAAGASHAPTVVAGDFNATWGNEGFRHLIDDGFVDAAAARGVPDQFTWPNDASPLPPFLRIDHVLTRGSLVVTHVRTGRGVGSDHRPVVATVAFLPG